MTGTKEITWQGTPVKWVNEVCFLLLLAAAPLVLHRISDTKTGSAPALPENH